MVVWGVLILTDGVTSGVIVMVTLLLVAVVGEAHATLLVSTQLTTSLLTRVVDVYVTKPVPALLPFNFHWYVGEFPPLPGVAVKVTLAPEHTVVCGVLILRVGVTDPDTVMVTAFDVAVAVVTHV